MYNKGPFAPWVPKPLMLLLIFVIMLPMMAISGVYAPMSSDVYSALGVYPEYITLASNAGTIGMGAAILIFIRIKTRFRSKEIITGSAILLAGLCYWCAVTQSPVVIVLCSMLIGFIKLFPMFEMILPAMMVLSPSGHRGKFYSIFYPLAIGFGQWAPYLMQTMVAEGNWQAPYFLGSAVMLVVAAISLIFQHNQRFSFRVPLYQVDWLTLLLLVGSFMSLNYGLVFMKQQDWFYSPYVVSSLVLSFVLFVALVYRQKWVKRALIDFSVFRKSNVIHATVLLMLTGLYLSSSLIFTQYTVGVLGYNNLINARLNLWMIPGVIFSGMLAYWGFSKQWPLKYYILAGFGSMFLFCFALYTALQPQMDIRYLEHMTVLKGLGLGILFIGVWFYASLNLTMNQMLGMMGILIVVRSFVSTAFGVALLSYGLYEEQWQSLNTLSNYLDSGNALQTGANLQATTLSAVMNSGKIILGGLCWLIVPTAFFVLTHSYGNFNFRRVIFLRKIIRGNSVKGYKLS